MKTKVIIIDDHQLFNDGLSLILKESTNFEVISQVYDSRHAVYECYKQSPDLVLVDYNMPNLNGLEVVNQLKLEGATYKIVVISMYADSKEISLFRDAGINGYLPKTTPAKELIISLTHIMEGKFIFESLSEKKTSITQTYPAFDQFGLKSQLTKREIEILKIIKKGYTSEQIAQELNLSIYTIETHRKNINQKLPFKTKKEFYDFLETVGD